MSEKLRERATLIRHTWIPMMMMKSLKMQMRKNKMTWKEMMYQLSWYQNLIFLDILISQYYRLKKVEIWVIILLIWLNSEIWLTTKILVEKLLSKMFMGEILVRLREILFLTKCSTRELWLKLTWTLLRIWLMLNLLKQTHLLTMILMIRKGKVMRKIVPLVNL